MQFDAVIVGSGPNGLAAAIELARAGCSVAVFEAAGTIGGGTRTAELTLPGFVHDVCSAIHPLGVCSPFFRSLNFGDFGLEWIHPALPLAHAFHGQAIVLDRSIEVTAQGLGEDSRSYASLLQAYVRRSETLVEEVLAPAHLTRHPFLMARFALDGLRSAHSLASARFSGERARALFAGLAAHSILPLTSRPSAAFGLLLAVLGHAVGWPLPKGGSQKIADALGERLRALGGRIFPNTRIDSLNSLPPSRAVLCDISPNQLMKLVPNLPQKYYNKLSRFRYGPGIFKVDWALRNPIPWLSPECGKAGTVHVGGSLEEIAAAEHAASHGKLPEAPFVLLAQPSIFDTTRAPAGHHTAWAYCHVPNGSTVDMTERIERRIEAFAPGFRDCIEARHTMTTRQIEAYNPNNVGGHIGGGLQDLGQLFKRPASILNPYRTPIRGLYLCSASTPPGGGVHGMCGYNAARAALRDMGK